MNPDPASDRIVFWIEPTASNLIWCAVAVFALVLLVLFLNHLVKRREESRQEKEFAKRLDAATLAGRPEEAYLRTMVKRYHIRPPAQILSSLPNYDAVAGEEIIRLETAPMPLQERLDCIEFLYSIRMLAFADDPSVGGVGRFLGELPSIRSSGALTEVPPIQSPDEAEDSNSEIAALLGVEDRSSPVAEEKPQEG